MFFFYGYGDHRDLHVLTHSFPTRRSSDLFLSAANRLGTPLGNVEKDFWVCWTLDQLYHERSADQPRLLFKGGTRSEEHTSELQSLMRISYAVFCLKKKKLINIIQ